MFINKANQELILKLTSIINCTYENKDTKQATCFFCQKSNGKIILITNKHVFEGALNAQLYLTVRNMVNGDINNYYVDIALESDSVKSHSQYDISTYDFTDLYNSLITQQLLPEISMLNESGVLTNYDDLDIIQEILMLGYPGGIINETVNNPTTRVGVTATSIKSLYNNKYLFLTDIPTFWGSSGSPILIASETGDLYLVGINFESYLHEIPVYDQKNGNDNRTEIGYVSIPNDIGVAVNSLIIKEMLDLY